MNKKWTPHTIAIVSFIVFIVLGLACASSPAPSTTVSREPRVLFEQTYKDVDLHKNPNIFNDLLSRYGNQYIYYNFDIHIRNIQNDLINQGYDFYNHYVLVQ